MRVKTKVKIITRSRGATSSLLIKERRVKSLSSSPPVGGVLENHRTKMGSTNRNDFLFSKNFL
jgi:hypothetical protein